MGGPYLLAWQSGDEFLLRDLTDDEARKLQQLCVAGQAEVAVCQMNHICESSADSQLALF
jgi:hypothetical protein